MQIAELARRAGVKVSTVRFYERAGVLPEPVRTVGGYRDYAEDDAVRLRFLRRGQQLGFTLSELSEFDQLSRSARGGHASAADVSAVAAVKLIEIDQRIADLERTRQAIVGLLDEQCVDLSEPCPIIAALGAERASG